MITLNYVKWRKWRYDVQTNTICDIVKTCFFGMVIRPIRILIKEGKLPKLCPWHIWKPWWLRFVMAAPTHFQWVFLACFCPGRIIIIAIGHRSHGAGIRYIIYIYTHNYVCVIIVIVVYIYIYMIYLQYTLVTIKTSTMEPTENASFMSSCWRCVLTHVAPQPILLGNRWTSHTWGKLQRIP